MRRILRRSFVVATALALAPLAAPLAGQTDWTSDRPDGHAPIGVMGDHTHEAGEYMLSYRYMRMHMEGNRIGRSNITAAEVLRAYMVSPLEMPMNMHMVGAMYAPSDRLTLMAMASFVDQSMDHVTRSGNRFTTRSSGIGDTRIAALVGLKRSGSTRLHLNATVSLPTGSIDETDVTPASLPGEAQLPYPMQIGSGTFDLMPGFTWLGMRGNGSWGVQGTWTVRLGENDRDYALGDALEGTIWLAYRVTDRISASARVVGRSWADIEGADPTFMNPRMVPTIVPETQGGNRVDVPLGLNYYFPDGALAGHRLAVEMSLPAVQDLSGPQLETDWILTVGWQKSF